MIITACVVGIISGTAGSAETNMYHTNRVFTPVTIHVSDNPTVFELYTESGKLTDIVAAGTNITINTNETYAIERQVISLGFASATAAWDAAVSYDATNSMEQHYPGAIYDNVGWVRGTKSTVQGEWGSYFYSLRNRIVFKSSQTNWWRSPSNGVPVAIAKVMVGTLGDYAPMEDVVDVGPSLEQATNNFPGENTGEDKRFRADITNVYYQLVIPFIWITPRTTYTTVGGSNVQYTVTGTNISNGVTWTISPSGLSGGATIQPSNDWHYAGVTPGTVATNYKVRATSVDNTNFHDEVNLTVVGVQTQLQYKIGTNSWSDIPDPLYVCSNTTVNFKATKIPTNASWPSGKPVWGGVVSGSGMETNSYTFNSISTSTSDYKIVTAECGNTVTGKVIVVSVTVTNIKFNYDNGSATGDALNIRKNYSTSYDVSNGEWVKGATNIPAAYIRNTTVSIKAKLIVTPLVSISAKVSAISSDAANSLGNVAETTVSFLSGVSNPEFTTFSISNAIANCVKKGSHTWQWKIKDVNGTGSPECDLNQSGSHEIYTVLSEPKSPMQEAWADVLYYGCDWAGNATNDESVCVQILNNGFNQHYTWSYDCNLLSSDFVRLVASLGVNASQHIWASKGSQSSGDVDDMCYQRTKSFTPVGGSPDVREWSWHQWAESTGAQRDPSAATSKTGNWGGYEDDLFTHYYQCTNSSPFGAVWVANQSGQSSGCEVYPTHCYYDSNPTLYDWRGPDR